MSLPPLRITDYSIPSPLPPIIAPPKVLSSSELKNNPSIRYGSNKDSFSQSNFNYKTKNNPLNQTIINKTTNNLYPTHRVSNSSNTYKQTLTGKPKTQQISLDELTNIVNKMTLNPTQTSKKSLPYNSITNSSSFKSNASPKIDTTFSSFDTFNPKIDTTHFIHPINLNIKLLPHQIEGVEWLTLMEDKEKGSLLADDMGLGKTIQTLSLILKRPGPTLIVTPLSVLFQWRDEISQKCSGVKVLVHHGNTRLMDSLLFSQYDIVLTTYDILSREMTTTRVLVGFEWYRIVLDEAHIIKNHKTLKAKSCFELISTFRSCLSGNDFQEYVIQGTPIQNNIQDLYSFLMFLRIEPLNDFNTFKTRVLKPTPSISIPFLKSVFCEFTLRRTKIVLNQLPSRIVKLGVELEFKEDEEIEAYKELERVSLESIRFEKNMNYMQLCVLLLRLRQSCNHPFLPFTKMKPYELDQLVNTEESKESKEIKEIKENTKSDESNGNKENKSGIPSVSIEPNSLLNTKKFNRDFVSTKMFKVLDILTKTKTLKTKSGKQTKTILFSQFVEMIHIVESYLTKHNIKSLKYIGEMSNESRQTVLNEFKQGESSVLLVSLLAGSCGLNLTIASQVILFDLWWNPMIEEQCIDRVHRIGQENNVFVYKLFIKETVEERVLLLQDKKRNIAKEMMNDSSIVNEKLNHLEIMKLIQSNK